GGSPSAQNAPAQPIRNIDPVEALGLQKPTVVPTAAAAAALLAPARAASVEPAPSAASQAIPAGAQSGLPQQPRPSAGGGAAPPPGVQSGVQSPNAAQQRRFTGHPISLDFQGADLRAVLRTFAEISSLNIVIDPAIQGTVDVALRDVPWDQALDIILRATNLGSMPHGTIVHIPPL